MKTEAPQMERPVIFKAAMVRAILEGRKTQTRRIVKGYNVEHFDALGCVGEMENHEGKSHDLGFGFYRDLERQDDNGRKYRYTGFLAWCGEYPEEGSVEITCPYGSVGERLWVRETFALHDDRDPPIVYYRADDPTKYESDGAWKPSIHMPRWASRLTLEITKVRVERLQDISEEDAKAEGVVPSGRRATHRYRASDNEDHGHRLQFQDLWNSINGAGAWDKNPWVWCISFQRHLTGNGTKSDNAMGASTQNLLP